MRLTTMTISKLAADKHMIHREATSSLTLNLMQMQRNDLWRIYNNVSHRTMNHPKNGKFNKITNIRLSK